MKALYFDCFRADDTLKRQFVSRCLEADMDYEIVDVERDAYLSNRYGVVGVPFIVVLDGQEEVAFSGSAKEVIPLL